MAAKPLKRPRREMPAGDLRDAGFKKPRASQNLLAAATVPVPLADEDHEAARLAIQQAWVENARRNLREVRKAAQIVPFVVDTITNATSAIDDARYGSKVLRENDASYYDRPVTPAFIKTDDVVIDRIRLESHDLQSVFDDIFPRRDLERESLSFENRDDIERIGSFDDLVAAAFWAEIHATHQRQTGWSAGERYWAQAVRAAPEQRRFFQDIARAAADIIHGVSAKDSTGKRAYYHVLLRDEDDTRFREALAGDGTIELEEFGKVVMSRYEAEFRVDQSLVSRTHLVKLMERYTTLAVRERSYSIPKRSQVFESERFKAALQSIGSREALLQQLADQTALLGPLPSDHQSSVSFLAPEPRYDRRFKADLAEQLFAIFSERCLSAAGVDQIVGLLLDPTEQRLAPILRSLNVLAQRIGPTETDAIRLLMLVCPNRNSATPHGLDALINLASGSAAARQAVDRAIPARQAWTAGSTRSSWANALGRLMGHTPARLPDLSWQEARLALATADAILQLAQHAPGLEESFSSAVFDLSASRRLVDQLTAAIGESAELKTWIEGSEAIKAAGIRVEKNISKSFLEISADMSADAGTRKVVEAALGCGIIWEITSIATIGTAIDQKTHDVRTRFISSILEESLSEIFDELVLPEDRRREITARIATAIVGRDSPAGIEARLAAPPGPGIPAQAPALWESDRKDRQTPPSFIREHYGDYLRADGSGLTLPSLRTIDPALYRATHNWRRYSRNVWPDDCPLPTQEELLDARQERLASEEVRTIRSKINTVHRREINRRRER